MSGLVFGIDIIKGSVRSGSNRPHYALVRAESGKILFEEKNVTLYKLLGYLNRERPEVLAVDSIQEIAKDTSELYEFLANLPSETKLVQVTGDGVKMETLPRVAARYNIPIDKTNPLDEAKASALIASLGGGFELIAYNEITDIIVSRHRSLGRGGWSQNRYIRKVHGSVKNRTREIEEKLKEANLSYELSVRSAFGGDSRSVFTVQAPRRLVPVSSSKGGDTQVKVSGRKKDRIEFTPLTKKSRYLFVGIDPGTTLGVAALDLAGEVLYLKSTRLFSASDVIYEITKIGKPILVASDKAEMPFGVEKIRRAFAAVPWTPKKDILIREKYQLAEGYGFKNDHERDALSAALYAYKSYKNKFDGVLKRAPSGIDTEELLAKIVQGLSLPEALSEISDAKTFTKIISAEPVSLEPAIFDERDEKIAKQEEMIRKLRSLAGELSEELAQKEKIISSLNRKLSLEQDETRSKVLASSEIAERDKELAVTRKALRKEERRCKNLRTKLERMKHYVALQAGDGCSALKVLQLLSRDAIRSLDDEMGVGSEDLLYVLKIDGWGKSVVRDLAEADVKAVILPRLVYEKAGEQHLIEEFRKANLPLLSGAKLSPRVRGKIGVLDTAALDAALLEWESSQDVYLKRKKAGEIDVMVKEYQVERFHEVKVLGIDPDTVIPEKFKTQVITQKPASPKPPRPPKPKSLQKTFMKDEPVITSNEPVKTKDLLTSVLTEYKKERKKEITGEEDG